MFHSKKFPLFLCVLTAMVNTIACQFDDITNYGSAEWNDVENPATEDLLGIWGSSTSDIWVVGESGLILHYDGESWNRIESNTQATLTDIWGAAPDDIWAVGGHNEFNGTVLHYDGNEWSEIVSHAEQRLAAVWGSSSTDIYVVGDADRSALLKHWDGNTWESVTLPEDISIGQDIWGDGPDNVFVVAFGEIVHFDGASWTIIDQGFAASYPAFAMWGSSSSNVHLAGSNGVIRRWNGAKWSNLLRLDPGDGYDIQFLGLSGTSTTNVFAVGHLLETVDDAPPRGHIAATRIFYFNGFSWTMQNTGTLKMSLTDVWSASALDAWAVGESGTILRYRP
ncbi:MAG: hypothetical protein GY847_00610 [Proteobacteria bacterium]|nr:hypothetical protein [Pseudomonadota bacterium]